MKPKLNWKKLLLLTLFLAGIGAFFLTLVSYAQTTGVPDLGLEPVRQELGLPDTDVRVVVARIIRVALGFLGIVALVLILYAGFTWMTAGGNEEKIQKAKKILMNAVIGLVIILSAYAIVSFVLRSLLMATTGGTGGEGGAGEGGAFSRVFYITSMPGNDFGCGARNLHPIIRFNKSVDITTVANNLVLRKKIDATPANGSWAYQVVGGKTITSALVFNPVGDCGVEGHTDCLDASTTYQIFFANSGNIKSQAPDILSLNCNVGGYKSQCKNDPAVEFATGDGVDVENPTIIINNPFENQNFAQGASVPVEMSYTDNFGLQDISLFVNDSDVPVGVVTISGCKKSGTSTITWPSGVSPTGTYALNSLASDQSGNSATATRHVKLIPAHCFDTLLNFGETIAGPPACGDGCGSCAGEACTENSDCASGWCEGGVCVDRMRIDRFDPIDGAASSTYVTISGQFFGDDGGHVYFTKQGGGWTEAFIVSCGAGIDNWTQYQLVVKVPPNAANGPIKVATAEAPTDGSDDVTRRYTDVTDSDGWGYFESFTVTDILKPGLCALIPNYGPPYSSTTLIGENFGATNDSGNDKVVFGSSTAIIRDWASRTVTARVPSLGTGPVAVKIYNDGQGSNAVRFDVRETLDQNAPMIESINPDSGARGEYITIIGKNFGSNVGKVLFKLDGDGEAKYGSFNFPAECEGSTWSDKQIIVKFPEEVSPSIPVNRDYSVQIQRSSDAKIGPIGAIFKLQTGNPAPGICKLSPSSGPVPFNPSSTMKIYGEYYKRSDTTSTPYFWQTEASPTTTENRVATVDIVSETDQQAEIRPPEGSETGPVVMHRTAESKTGNSLPFTVYNCVENKNICYSPGTKCCTKGDDAGLCKLEMDLCAGETRATGYMWRFSTGPFPPVPKVLERCDATTDQGLNLPSPSPDIRWTGLGNFDHFNACRTAMVNIEFTMQMDPTTVNASNIQIFKCVSSSIVTSFANDNNTCTHDGAALLMADGSYDLDVGSGGEFGDTSFIQMSPSALSWQDNTWYQVVLKKGIKSVPVQYEYKGETRTLAAQNISANNSCGGDSAYCFIFKTNSRNCQLNKVVVTPYEYWTSILESPVKYRSIKSNADDAGSTLYYKGSGLSDQHCILMDMRNYNWLWSSQRPPYSTIFGTTTQQKAQVTALANTVAVGLSDPANAVMIKALATQNASFPIEEDEPEGPVEVVTDGLLGWWKFDGTTDGQRTMDSSGNENSIILHGGYTYASDGKIGQAIQLNGTNAYADFTDPYQFPFEKKSRTICAWGKPDSVAAGWRWMMAYGTAKNSSSTFIGMNGTTLYGGGFGNDIQSASFWQPGVWKHVCLSFDGSLAKLYGDGVLLQSQLKNWSTGSDRAYIGAQAFASPIEFWQGYLDDIRVYDRVLTADEVLQIYQYEPAEAPAPEEEEGDVGEPKEGQSPLTIDLSRPRVTDYWPKCLEACTNAEIGAKFNIMMANVNVDSAVKLVKCLDENCLTTEPVLGVTKSIDPADRRFVKMSFGILGGELATDTVYAVTLSTTGTSTAISDYQLWSGASITNEYAKSKPMQEEFVWRFRTKKEKCVLDTVNIIPALFRAIYVNDRHVYSAEARSAPDACDPKGQKLDTWTIDWRWKSSSSSVATVQEFKTKGRSPLCTDNCIRKGSDVTSDASSFEPLCGNNVIEAGEDCDPPLVTVISSVTTTACSLNCLRPGNIYTTTTIQLLDAGLCGDGFVSTARGEECDPNDNATKVGCSKNCVHTGSLPATGAEDITASICGNGKLGIGEECDLGVAADYKISTSSVKCSPTCLHLGTSLSAGWCAENTGSLFGAVEYKAACAKSKSQCGDGIRSPSEDPGCDCGSGNVPYGDHMCSCDGSEISADIFDNCPTVNPACSTKCLGNSRLTAECNPVTTTIIGSTYIETRTEGCGEDSQFLGSSLMYSVPSVCGDGIVGIGEEMDCESGFLTTHFFTDPWTLARGVGLGSTVTTSFGVAGQVADIQGTGSSTVNGKNYQKADTGKFEIICGYKTDLECQNIMGNEYGVAANSCCMPRPWLVSTYPIKTIDENAPYDICPNTYIEAKFNHLIDEKTLTNQIYVAKGITASSCPAGTTDVTPFVDKVLASAINDPWYKRLWHGIIYWFAKLFGDETSAAPYTINSSRYCYEEGILDKSKVIIEDSMAGVMSTSSVMIRLKKPLATSTDYVVILRPGVKDIRGVSVATSSQWKFITGDKLCELENVAINPDTHMFNSAGSSTNFIANSSAANGQKIQAVDGYRWDYIWTPEKSDYVSITITTDTVNYVTSKNRNGELDLLATTNFTENFFTSESPSLSGKSRITVFICENPWPSSSTVQFPFKDLTYDFTTYYCMDKGSAGFADDLPYVTSSRVWTTGADTYKKRYLFTNTDNKDAIGMQVFYNTNHYSVSEWYFAQGFTGSMSPLKIDGYNAITDNNNYYIDALDYSDSNIYSNIYQFSINNDATADTKNIFKQMMENLKFNSKLKNDKYCGVGYGLLDTVNYNLPCESDLDCLANVKAFRLANPGITIADTYSCLNQKDKLQRNYQRLKDLKQSISALNFGRDALAIWPFDSITGGKTLDTTKNANHLSQSSLKGVTFSGGSLSIGTTGKLISDTQVGGRILDKSFTIAGKINSTFPEGGSLIILTSSGDGVFIDVTDGGKLSICNESEVGSSDLCTTALNCANNPVINDGNWHSFVVAFINSSVDTLKLYVDGKEICSPTGQFPNMTPAATFRVGAHHTSDGYSAMLDDFRIYTRVLSQDEISAYDAGNLPNKEYPLVKENTYLNGQALSVWPNSWAQLGVETGESLPVDPINQLVQSGTCFQKTGLAYAPCYKDADCAPPPQMDRRMSFWSADNETMDEGVLQNHATIEGTVNYVNGKGSGQAFEFVGDSGTKIIAAHKPEYNNDNFTLSAWIYPTKKNTATIIKKGGTDGDGNSIGGFVLEYSGFWSGMVSSALTTRFNNGTIRFAFFPTSTAPVKYYTLDSAGTPLTLNQWHHIAIKFNDESGDVYMFIDGVNQNQQIRLPNGQPLAMDPDDPLPKIFDNTQNIEIGQSFNGLIDRVAFYDSALSHFGPDNQVENLYKGLCILHDPMTGWSAEDRRFSFACNTTSYAYRYVYDNENKKYKIRANMEKFANVLPSNNRNFFDDFLGDAVGFSQTEFTYVDLTNGICINNNEISSPYNIVCGDGVIGGTETCDPPGKVEINSSLCPTSQATKKTCSINCSWGATSNVGCYVATGGSCGDGKVQAAAGELCDDGPLNGTSGRCASNCQGVVNNCGNGTLDAGEFCDTVASTGQCEFAEGASYEVDPNSEPIFYFLVDLTTTMNSTLSGSTISRIQKVRDELPNIAERFSSSTAGTKAKIGIGTFSRPSPPATTLNTNHNNDRMAGSIGYYTKLAVTTAVNNSTFAPQGGGQNTDSAFYWFIHDVWGTWSIADRKHPVNLVYITDGGGSTSCGSGVPVGECGALYPDAVIEYLYDFGITTHVIGVGATGMSNESGVTLPQLYQRLANKGHGEYFQISTAGDSIASALMDIYKKPCSTYDLYSGYSCRWDCKAFGNYCGDDAVQAESGEECEEDQFCTIPSGEPGKQKCDGCKLGECEATVEVPVSGACGNGVIEESEACDRGDKNGIVCDPVYPQVNCTYCSYNCQNVITVDNLCGNGIIDSSAGELCDPEHPLSSWVRQMTSVPTDVCMPCKNDCSGWNTSITVPTGSQPVCQSYWGYCGDGKKQTVYHGTSPSPYEFCDGTDDVSNCPACTSDPTKPYKNCTMDCRCTCSNFDPFFIIPIL